MIACVQTLDRRPWRSGWFRMSSDISRHDHVVSILRRPRHEVVRMCGQSNRMRAYNGAILFDERPKSVKFIERGE